jgi:hypothetical protein
MIRYLRPASLAIGLLFLGYTLSGLVRTRGVLMDTEQADAVVVATRPSPDGGATPVLRFTTPQGSVIEWADRTSRSAAAIGDHVPVLYRPDGAPVMVGSFWRIYGLFLGAAICGFILVALGAPAAAAMIRGRARRT